MHSNDLNEETIPVTDFSNHRFWKNSTFKPFLAQYSTERRMQKLSVYDDDTGYPHLWVDKRIQLKIEHFKTIYKFNNVSKSYPKAEIDYVILKFSEIEKSYAYGLHLTATYYNDFEPPIVSRHNIVTRSWYISFDIATGTIQRGESYSQFTKCRQWKTIGKIDFEKYKWDLLVNHS